MAKYIIHKAVDLHKLAAKTKPTEDELNSSNYVWQPKIDGCNMVAVVNHGQVTLLSRTGEPVLSAGNLVEALKSLPSAVYLGEYVIPNTPFPVISGHFRNQQVQVDAQFYMFDVLSLQEWSAGKSNVRYDSRASHLPSVAPSSPLKTIYSGTRRQAEGWMERHSELNYDGLVARKVSGPWLQGSSGLTGEIIKIKNILSLDLELKEIRTASGAKTGRKVYTLVVEYDGHEIVVGSGVPHLKAQLPKIGSIVEIEALGTTTGGVLREPRFKGVRTDKLEPDA